MSGKETIGKTSSDQGAVGVVQKPPLGAMPRQIHMEKRISELTRAISEYIEEGRWEFPSVDDWLLELMELLRTYRRLYHENQWCNRLND